MQQDTCSAPTVLIGLHLYKLLIKRGIKELKFKKRKQNKIITRIWKKGTQCCKIRGHQQLVNNSILYSLPFSMFTLLQAITLDATVCYLKQTAQVDEG